MPYLRKLKCDCANCRASIDAEARAILAVAITDVERAAIRAALSADFGAGTVATFFADADTTARAMAVNAQEDDDDGA